MHYVGMYIFAIFVVFLLVIKLFYSVSSHEVFWVNWLSTEMASAYSV